MVLYKHLKNTDIVFQILKSFYIQENQTYKLKIAWWNIGACHKPWPMGITQNIKITKDKMRDWEVINIID